MDASGGSGRDGIDACHLGRHCCVRGSSGMGCPSALSFDGIECSPTACPAQPTPFTLVAVEEFVDTAGKKPAGTNTHDASTIRGRHPYGTHPRSRLARSCSILFGGPIGTPPWVPRELLLVLYMASALLTACVYFGFPAIRRMLLASGAYGWLCDDAEHGISVAAAGTEEADEGLPNAKVLCDAQDAAVAPLFIIAMVSHSLMSAVAGTMLDHIGPKFTALAGQGLNALGWVLLASSSERFPAYIPAFVCIGLGADTGYLPLLKIVNLFGRRSATVISLVGVACTASFGVPMVLEMLWLAQPRWSFSHVCSAYILLGPGMCIPIALFLIPWKAFPTPEEDATGDMAEGHKTPSPSSVSTSGSSLPICLAPTGQPHETSHLDHPKEIRAATEGPAISCATEEMADVSDKCTVCVNSSPALTAPSDSRFLADTLIKEAGPSFVSEVLSVRFLCIPIFASSQQLAVAFFQVASQRLLAPPVAGKMDQFLSLAFIPCVLIGTAIDYFGIFPVLFVMNSFGLLAYVCCLGPPAVSVHFISLVSFCGYVSLDSELVFCCVNKMFSPRNFGRLSGIAQAIGGLTSLISIPLYNNISVKLFGGDCQPVSWGMAAMMACVYPLISLMWWLTVRKRK